MIREIDALDGVCARLCDRAGIAFHVLNRRHGPAVYGLRAQIDRQLYKSYMQDEILRRTPNLQVCAGAVDNIQLVNNDNGSRRVSGVILDDGQVCVVEVKVYIYR